MNKSYNFTQKIECIYKNIAKSNIFALVELFENGTDKKHRAIHIQNKWLRKSNKDYKPRAFKKEYFSYPFYKTITIDGKPLFKSGEEFLEISLEEFCQRIHSFVNASKVVNSLQDKFNFEYFLYYSQECNSEYNIRKLHIVYGNFASLNQKEIKLFNLKEPEKVLYRGKIYAKEQKLILEFSNNNDHIMAIFNLEMLNNKSKELIGVAIGISDINQKVPVAKKVALLRYKPTKSDLTKLYLTLNKTEIIFANENSFNYEIKKSDILHKHFNKYYDKIDRLDKFFSTVTRSDFNSVKYRLAKEQLHSTKNIFERIKSNQEFYIFSFFKGLKSILLPFKEEKYIKLYMVMPIYNKDFLFNYFSKDARETLALFEELAKYSIEIEIIFITDICYKKFSIEFSEHLKTLQNVASVYFVHKDKISSDFISNEFIYSDKRNFIFFKPKRSYKNIYKYSSDSELIDYTESFYFYLRHSAMAAKSFLQSGKLCRKEDIIYNSWYLYLQGTKQLWQLKLNIYSDNTVTIKYQDKITDKGVLVRNKEQSVIITQDVKSGKSMSMYFDNKKSLENLFLLYTTAKAYMKEDTIFSIAIASKEMLETKNVEELLKEDCLHCKNALIEERLSDFIFEKYGK